MLPVTTAALVALSKVNPADAPALPLLLNSTCVLSPGTTMLPEMLPAKLPKKNPSVTMLPVAEIWPAASMLPTVLPATVPAFSSATTLASP